MSARQSGATDVTYTFDDLAVVMATDDADDTIAAVLDDIEAVTDGRASVVCVDESADRTPEIAREHGATVVEREPQRDGAALRRAVLAPERPVVATVDADAVAPAAHLPAFLDEINDGADVVSGDRRYESDNAMPAGKRLRIELLALLASVATGERVHDATTGMRAYRRDLLAKIRWTEGAGLPAELLIRPLLRGYDVRERPIAYDERGDETGPGHLGATAAIAVSVLRVAFEERLR